MRKTLIVLLFFAKSIEGISQHDYALAQHLSTRFLGAQRCGNTKSWIQPESSSGCHTTDGQAVGKDLSGGWHDCGDYIKFHVTGPYTALIYLYGYDKFPEAYPDNYSQDYSKAPGNGIPDVLDEVKIETDYLIKCINGNTIYWQIGDGRDHNSFNEPVSNSNQTLYNSSKIRPVYSTIEGKSNALGSSAAALALMSILYQPFDEEYALQCKNAAIAYYTVGKINQAVTADARTQDGFYAWLSQYSDYKDEMGMAAALLYRSTKTASYLTEATNYATPLSQSSGFDYGTLNPILFYELYQITGTASWLNKVASQVNSYSLKSCGYFHNTNWGSLRDAGNAAFLAALYHKSSGNTNAYSFAKSNIDFILGTHTAISTDAPANFSFLIGYNKLNGGFPKRPHHAAAFGKSTNAWGLYDQEKNTPGSVTYGYTLSGALAGGPESACSNFTDNIDNYVSSEYCIYYNAAFTGAVAYINKVENNLTLQQAPYGNKRHLIPGIIEFEKYDIGGQNVSFYDLTPANEGKAYREDAVDIENSSFGGYNIGWTQTGEWLEYSVTIQQSTNYRVNIMHASQNGTGSLKLSIDGTFVTSNLDLSTTGGNQVWKTTTFNNIPLNPGNHILKVEIISGNINLEKMEFILETVTGDSEIKNTNFSIYPNPVSDAITISGIQTSGDFIIMDTTGKTIFQFNTNETNSLNLSFLKAGTYIIKSVEGNSARLFVKI